MEGGVIIKLSMPNYMQLAPNTPINANKPHLVFTFYKKNSTV
jgi:hypothetical protein